MTQNILTRRVPAAPRRTHFAGLIAAVVIMMPLFLGGTRVAHAAAGGTTWQVVPSPNPSTTPVSNDVFSAVSALADKDVWAVGSFSSTSGNDINHTLTEHWDGTAWSIVPSPNAGTQGSELLGVAAVAHSDVWAVGDLRTSSTVNGNRTLIEHYDGTAWSVVPSPNPSSQGDDLTAVAAISASNVWAVGYYESNNQNAIVPLVVHWNGTAWSSVTAGLSSAMGTFLQGITALSANDIWAVGDAGLTSNRELHWNGTRWSVMSASFASGGQEVLDGVAAISSKDVWAVGSYVPTKFADQQTLALHWDGTTWSQVTSANVDKYFNLFFGVAALRSNDVWAVGYAYTTNGLGFTTLTEHWDGSTWTVVPSPTPNGSEFRGVAASGPTGLWAAGSFDSLKQGNPGLRTLTAHTTQG